MLKNQKIVIILGIIILILFILTLYFALKKCPERYHYNSTSNPINLTGNSPYSGLVCFDEDGTWAQHSNDDPDQQLPVKQSKIIEYLVQNDKVNGKNYVVGIISAGGSSKNITIDDIAHDDYLMIAQMNKVNKVTNNAIGSSIINGKQMTKNDVSKILNDYAKKCGQPVATSIGSKKCDILVQNIDMLKQNGILVSNTGILVDNDSTVCKNFDERASKWKLLGYTLYSVNLGTIKLSNYEQNPPKPPKSPKLAKCQQEPFKSSPNSLCLVNIQKAIH